MIAIVDALGLLAAAVLAALALWHLRLSLRARPLAGRLLAEPPAPLAGADLPGLLVQIPVFNEPETVEGALRAAAAFDWPRERLAIQLLDDSTDGTSARAARLVEALRADGLDVEHLRRPARAGFKAGALAAGLSRSRAPFVAVLDADFRAAPDWPRRAVGLLLAEPRAAFVQFRFEFANRDQNALTRAQQLTVDAHFLCEQAGRLAAGEPVQFNGTAGIWRRAAIEDAGGWSGDTLAEDLDLALRAQARGWRAALALAPPLACEAPADARSWRVQQRRWSAGFVEVARAALPRMWTSRLPLRAKLGATQLLALQAAFPCALLAVAAFAVDALARGFGAGHLALLLAGLGLVLALAVALTAPAWRGLRRGGLLRYALTLLSVPALFAWLALANSAAVVGAVLRRGGRDFVRTPKAGRN